jgi:aminomethyltransferase
MDLGLKIDFSQFAFMSGRNASISGISVFISRCGYTGEDGFEIRVNHKDAVKLCTVLYKHDAVELAGLGARDSLRLEAGLCLYGHDLNEDINPVEAGLVWTIGKRRRSEGGFNGFEHIVPKIKGGVSQKRIGLLVEGAPARGN